MNCSIFTSPDLWPILLTMLVGGLMGGLVNHFSQPAKDPPPVDDPPPAAPVIPSSTRLDSVWQSLISGVGAALLVPIFLFLTQSKLLDELVAIPETVQTPSDTTRGVVPRPPATTQLDTTGVRLPETGPKKDAPAAELKIDKKLESYFVFFSLCVLVAISGFRFINSVTNRFLSDLEKKVDATGKVAKEAREVGKDAQNQAKLANDQARENAGEIQKTDKFVGLVAEVAKSTVEPEVAAALTQGQLLKTPTSPPAEAVRLAAAPPADDPQKGFAQGRNEAGGYHLSATATALPGLSDWFRIRLQVTALDPAKRPLTGTVTFRLHPSFVDPVRPITAEDNVAMLEVVAWGGFTVGAQTSDGTKLEIDLADPDKVPGTTKTFRER